MSFFIIGIRMWESDARMANTVQCPISLLILSWLWLPWIRFCFCCKSHEKNQSRENFSITYHPSIASQKYLYLWGHFVPSTISPYRVNTITLSSSSSTTLAPFRVGHNQPILNASTQSGDNYQERTSTHSWAWIMVNSNSCWT